MGLRTPARPFRARACDPTAGCSSKGPGPLHRSRSNAKVPSRESRDCIPRVADTCKSRCIGTQCQGPAEQRLWRQNRIKTFGSKASPLHAIRPPRSAGRAGRLVSSPRVGLHVLDAATPGERRSGGCGAHAGVKTRRGEGIDLLTAREHVALSALLEALASDRILCETTTTHGGTSPAWRSRYPLERFERSDPASAPPASATSRPRDGDHHIRRRRPAHHPRSQLRPGTSSSSGTFWT